MAINTYYVIGAGGSDSNDGSNDTTQGWATIDKAMNTVAAGDLVYVKATGTYTEDATIDNDLRAGTADAPIIFEGYTTTPGDGGKVTHAAATASALTGADNFANAIYIFKNFIYPGGGTGASINPNDIYYCTWINCDFTGSGSGTGCVSNNTACHFYNCTFTGTDGSPTVDAQGRCCFINCVFHGNTGQWTILAGSPTIIGCLFYNNTGTAPEYIRVGASESCIMNNTFDGENTANSYAVYMQGSLPGIFLNNIIYDFNTGIAHSSVNHQGDILGYNLINSNNTNYSNVVNTEGGDVTGAPAFTDEANRDYSLDGTSPAINAGVTLDDL